MVRKMIYIVIALTLIMTLGGWAVGTAKADQCTAQQGQIFIDAGQYKKAVQEFTCVINAQPTEVEGYRGRIEAQLLLGEYSNAVRDYTKVTALVLPVHPDAESTIMAGYAARLASAPDSVPALTGKSFAQWWFFHYTQAIQTFNNLLAIQPDNVYGNLFRGSSRMLSGAAKFKGMQDVEYAITLAPNSPDVRYIVADAYTYGQTDPTRAFAEATFALNGGLNTPRVHAILAASYNAFGDLPAAADHILTHFELVTTELVATAPLPAGTTFSLDLVPGRAYEIPVTVNAGEMISIDTSGPVIWDTILVMFAPDGTPVLGSDDANAYYAAFNWVAAETGTYKIWVTSFESVNTGVLVVERN